ncbi:MAG: UDP-N-acetylmuramoyl-tripeptide-D-alanyl-D-alanine ligase [Parcubacteria group bacterium GW2011_GWC2_42_6]|nr:MAG: UDP-N-acetylmuramoyl-tripeptide-D-alanyl-D-alanine ligase [Parcubacteria group bacterium GW2011_GWC2_42_6]
MKNILIYILKIFARLYLWRYRPKIIGITGSVGKTSAKEAIFTVLNDKFNVRKNYKNYNNEVGVPLTIIGSETGGGSYFKWSLVFLKRLFGLIYTPHYPDILILEMGADKIGDISYLLSFIKCDIGVMTAISDIPAHIKFFRTPAQVAREKVKLLVNLKKNGWAILNFDDQRVRAMAGHTKAKVISFGFSDEADIKISNLEVNLNNPEDAYMNFKIDFRGASVPFRLNKIFGEHQIYSFLAAIAAGLVFDMNLVNISQALAKYRQPLGRMNLIRGIKNTWIIDDSYNASPSATKAALDVLSRMSAAGRKIAVLGDMLELGSYSEFAHREVGARAAESINILLAVGSNSVFMVEEAKAAGLMEKDIHYFLSAEQASRVLQNIIQEGDLILVKGSQGMRMEKVVKEIMADPAKAGELLVRQDERWLER